MPGLRSPRATCVYITFVLSYPRIDTFFSSGSRVNSNARRALEAYDDVLERRADAPEPSPTNPGDGNQNLPPPVKVALLMTGKAL